MKQCPQLTLKRCKSFHVFRDNDRLTNLDENLLSQILSRLPTKDVVRTCILSKGWRYKWTTSYDMIVNDEQAIWPYTEDSFAKFMTRILKYSLPQRSIRLRFRSFYSLDCIQTWFSSALEHRLEVLNVYCTTTPGIVIPCSLLNSTCLKELKLNFSDSSLDVAAMNFAPNLTSLYISGVDIMNKNHNTSTTVKFKFPLLETFTLTYFKWLNVKSVELHAPSLTTFSSAPETLNPKQAEYSVVIIAPRLSTFDCGIFVPEKIILDGSSTVAARFDFFEMGWYDLEFRTDTGIRVRNLLNEFKNLEELHLSIRLTQPKVSELGPPLQRHDKLRRLTLTIQSNPELLIQLLHAAPSLKILSLTTYGWVDYDYDYEAMEEVPSCIVSQLEELEFDCFRGNKPQYNLLKFFCMNGQILKKLTMLRLSRERQDIVKKFVSAFRNVEFVF